MAKSFDGAWENRAGKAFRQDPASSYTESRKEEGGSGTASELRPGGGMPQTEPILPGTAISQDFARAKSHTR